MREFTLYRRQIALNQWLKDHNIQMTFTFKKLEHVYEFKGSNNGILYYTKYTEHNTFDAHWEDHIEEMVHSLIDLSLHNALNFRNLKQ